MDWSHELLIQKAKLYIQRGHDEERSSSLFPFWSILGFELVVRATLAKVSPALLADPADGENIMYAFGLSKSDDPRSISIDTALKRCRKVVPTFTEPDAKFCGWLFRQRNRELHTGAAVFEDFGTAVWLQDYYRILKVLLNHQGLELEELLGPDDATMANDMIATAIAKVADGVKALIRMTKDEFFRLDPEKQAAKRREAVEARQRASYSMGYKEQRKCPACAEQGDLTGERTRASVPRIFSDEEMSVEVSVLPTEFSCRCCGLSLTSYQQVAAAGFGGQFHVTERGHPMEFFNFDPSDLYEADYGND